MEFMRTLRRRWYLGVVVLVLTGASGVVVASLVQPTYTIDADVVLVPPRSVEDPNANRFLLMGGLSQAVDVLVRSLDSERIHQEVADQFPTATYAVAADATTSAPILVVTAESPSSTESEAVLETVVDQVPGSLDSMQERLGIQESAKITSLVVARDDEPIANQTPRVRSVVTVALLVLVLGLLLISALDGMLLRRRAGATGMRAAKQTSADAAVSPPEPIGVAPGPAAPPAAGDDRRPQVEVKLTDAAGSASPARAAANGRPKAGSQALQGRSERVSEAPADPVPQSPSEAVPKAPSEAVPKAPVKAAPKAPAKAALQAKSSSRKTGVRRPRIR